MNDSTAAQLDFRLTPYLRELLHGRSADDPLVRQFLPDERELEVAAHEIEDPIGDRAHSPLAGIVHRHRDRLLLKIQHVCPAYCRFCFRRESIGQNGEPLSGAELEAALEYVRAHPEVWEVILTGGDPFALSARRLGDVLGRLSAIPHLAIVRIHTRVPVVDPRVIDDELVDALARSMQRPDGEAMPLNVVVHVNHADELTPAATAALARLHARGIGLLSQTVLLKGVNDDTNVLEMLFRTLVRHRVRPYYLHHPDRARGTSHFAVSIETGRSLMRALRRRVSGLCLPTYVLDLPGGYGKIPIGPDYQAGAEAGVLRFADLDGAMHTYVER